MECSLRFATASMGLRWRIRGFNFHLPMYTMLCWPCANPRYPPPQAIEAELEELKAQSKVIRVLVHTQIKKINNWGQKKSHMLEVQVSHPAAMPQLHLLAALPTAMTAACT